MGMIGMARLAEDGRGRGDGVEGVGLGLQDGAAALLHLVGAGREASEKGIDVHPHLGGGAEAGIGADFLADPAPDVLVGIEVGAVGGQPHQAQVQVRRPQIGAQRVAAVRRRVVPDCPR